MNFLSSALKRMHRAEAGVGHPPCPKPQHEYVRITGDLLAFDLMDGPEICGGVELREHIPGDPTPWMAHTYGVDASFSSFGKVWAWLRNPDVRWLGRVRGCGSARVKVAEVINGLGAL